jgi:alpha-D-xyloside xylohydrolase
LLKWNDSKKTLSISDRIGEFNGMIIEHVFNVVLVNEKQGIGVDLCNKPYKTITYNGKKMEVKL